MKRLLLIIFACLSLFILVSCGGQSGPEMVNVRVEYKASEGGKIDGASVQEKVVEKGNIAYFNGVYAVADENYNFVKWSDGKEDRFRVDSLTESATFTAIFEAIPYYNIKYSVTKGGIISGKSTQKLEYGEYTTKVTAIPDTNYYFV